MLAETFVAMPFLIVTVEAALQGMDVRFEEVAAARRRAVGDVPRCYRPDDLVVPGRRGGTHLGPRRSASSGRPSPSPATSRGAPRRSPSLSIWRWKETERVAVALSLLLLAVSFVVLVALRGRWLGAIRR